MKNTVLTCLLLSSTSVFAESEIVPLDVKKGYWESNTELVFNKAMDDMLASLPESQRDAMTAMIKSKSVIPTVKTCMAEDSYKDFDKKLKESLVNEEGCEMNLKESSGTSFVGEYQCKSVVATFSIQVINDKRHVTEVVTTAGGEVQSKIQVTADWKGDVCPEDAVR